MKKIGDFLKEAKTKKEGYLTVEASMVFSSVFFVVLFIIFMGMVLYQQVNLQSLAMRASERGSVIYSSRVSDMGTGIKTLEDFKIRDPYRNVPFMDGGAKSDYESIINRYVAGNLNQGRILSGSSAAGNYTKVEDYLIAKKVRVSIGEVYDTPVSGMADMFGVSAFDINTTSVSVIVDSPDFVRNVDLAADVFKQTELFGKADQGYGKIMEALKKVTDLLQ